MYLEAYHAYQTDQEAADALGVTLGGFSGWRTRRGLPAHNRHGKPLPVAEEDRRRAAWEAHGSLAKAADALGMRADNFHAWAKSRQFPTVKARAALFARDASPVEARNWSAYCLNGSDADAASSVGIPGRSFGRWRRRRGLPPRKDVKASRACIEAAADAGNGAARAYLQSIGVTL